MNINTINQVFFFDTSYMKQSSLLVSDLPYIQHLVGDKYEIDATLLLWTHVVSISY